MRRFNASLMGITLSLQLCIFLMCIVLLSKLIGCSIGKTVEFKGNVYVTGSSVYRDSGENRFTTSFMTDDGLNGCILYDEDIYWNLAHELGTDEKELHELNVVYSTSGQISYAEIDGVVYFDYSSELLAGAASMSKWYSLSES